MINRREFLATSAVLLAGCTRSPAERVPPQPVGRLPIGFSTLGSPQWDWLPTLDFAAAHGYAAIELRGIRDQMDLTKVPELQPARLAQARRELHDRGLVVTDLGASANLHDLDPAKHDPQMAEARRFIDLASRMSVPYVRVFGNTYTASVPHERTIEQIGASLHELGDYALPRGVVVLLETHGDFTDSPTLLEIMRLADSPGAGLLWDAHHTFAFGHEQPEDTFRQIRGYVRHTHLKDSVPAGNDRRYVLTGTGQVPVRRQVEVLVRGGYRGYYCFEWEKRWHPEIEEPEIAFAQFATVVSGYLRDAGAKPLAG